MYKYNSTIYYTFGTYIYKTKSSVDAYVILDIEVHF